MPTRITDSFGNIKNKVNNALSQEMKTKFRKSLPKMKTELKRRIPSWITSQPEVASLLAEGFPGSLNSKFGFYPGQANQEIGYIISSISNSTTISVRNITNRLKGGITFNFQPTTFSNLFSSSGTRIITEKGTSIDWLDWLLLRGDSIIVSGYSYTAGPYGRSGGGNMRKGSSFRVDPQFSGTKENNFITRAFSNREKEITQIMSRVLNV